MLVVRTCKRTRTLKNSNRLKAVDKCYRECETTSRIRHPSEPSLPQKRHSPPRKNVTGRNEVGEGLTHLNYEERLKALKLQYLEKEG